MLLARPARARLRSRRTETEPRCVLRDLGRTGSQGAERDVHGAVDMTCRELFRGTNVDDEHAPLTAEDIELGRLDTRRLGRLGRQRLPSQRLGHAERHHKP